MDDSILINDDGPASVTPKDVNDEAASLAITVLRAAKRFSAADRLRLLEGVCEELSGAREKLRAQIQNGDAQTAE